VTSALPPPQIAEAIDDLEVLEPPPRATRTTSELEAVTANRRVRAAVARLAVRLPPGLIYQRHRPFLIAGLEAARERGVPLILEWNGSEVWTRRHWEQSRTGGRLLNHFLEPTERYIVSRADVIASISTEVSKMALQAGASAERVVMVPNAVDIDRIDRITRNLRLAPVSRGKIGWVGSFGPWHGAEVLVRALVQLDEGIRVLMIGEGSHDQNCRQLAEELGIADRIEWTGALAHDEAVRRLAGCEVLAAPHLDMPDRPFFGSPTKLFEYMALGRPIVASAVGQIGEVLQDGVTARLVSPDDATALATAIAEVLAAPDRGQALGSAARSEALAKHTWNHRAEAILERVGSGRGLQ
jgi:glycosyltransferase involved in cell wall biosynthesis